MEGMTDFEDRTGDSDDHGSWRREVSVAEAEDQVGAAIEALQDLYEELVDAPDELELVFCFADDEYDEELLKAQVNHWLFESHWPWVVMGADRRQETCCLMLAVGSIHEVTYGG